MERLLAYTLYIFIASLVAIIIFLLPATPLKYRQTPDIKILEAQKTILPTFSDETINLGIFKPHMQSSDTLSGIHESFGAGACILDYNNDGWMDLFLINGSGQRRYFGEKEWWQASTPFTLYKNTGLNSFKDVTETVLGKNIKGWGMGCVAADLDNDGDQDLIISNYGANTLLENNADGTFKDSTAHSNIKGNGWSTSILTADFNNDGLLDIYILNFIHYQQGLKTYEASSGYTAGKSKQFDASLFDSRPNQLYINKGNLVFEDVTHKAGLEDASGKGISAETLDINNDGYSDIFISNGQGGSNKLFINSGITNGDLSFSDASEAFKIASIQQTTGTKSADLNHDGLPDLFVGTDNKNSKLLYKKEPKPLLMDIARTSGLDKTETSGAMTWGVSLSDLNNDGNPDIFLANGFTKPDLLSPRKSKGQPNTILINTLTDFQSCDSNCYMASSNDRGPSRSVVPVDFDNDGDIDLYISQNNSLGQLLINTTQKKNWLGIKLLGSHSNRDALGSIVTLKTKDKTVIKKISNSGFLSSHDKRLIFHLGDESVDSLTIKWPSGLATSISRPPDNRYISILEGENTFTQYPATTPQPEKSRIIFSSRLHKIEVIQWLASTHHDKEANREANLILNDHPTDQELVRLIEISDLLAPQSAFKAYLIGLKSDNVELRLRSLDRLKQIEEEISSRFLLNLFSDPSPRVRCEVANTYQHFFQEEEAMIHSKYLAIPLLIQTLSDDNQEKVKVCAINALAESENHRAIQPLMQLISSSDKHSYVRTGAIDALGRLRDKKAATLLSEILHNPEESRENRYTAMSALKRLNAIHEDTFFKENLAAYYKKGEILDFLQLLLDLSNDPRHNIIINPTSLNQNLQAFATEKQEALTTDESTLIQQILSASQHSNEVKKHALHSVKPKTPVLTAQKIKELQKILSSPTAKLERRLKIMNDARVFRLFSSKKIIRSISTDKRDPLKNTATIFLVENARIDKELSIYKKQVLDDNHDEEYRFFVAKGLFKKAPGFVINNVLTKR